MTILSVSADHPFGIHNLPYGVYSVLGQAPRVATRYGDHVVDIAALLGDEETFGRASLNAFMAQGYGRWAEVRAALTEAIVGETSCVRADRRRAPTTRSQCSARQSG